MSVIHGAHGMDYVGRREGVRGGYLCGPGGAAVEGATFAEERRTGGGVDGTVLGRRVCQLGGYFGFGKGRVREASVGWEGQ